MKKLLVTGGAGFIGSEFVREGVKRGYKTILLDKFTYAGDIARLKNVEKEIVCRKADIVNLQAIEKIFKKEKPDVVVHFAAESHVDRSILDASSFIVTNVQGTQVLLDVARKYGIEKFINIATDEVYGELPKEGQFWESSPLNPNSAYSVSKAAADMLGRSYWRTFGLPVITVRPCNNYGPWQYPEKLIPMVVLKALKKKKIPVYGVGENVREWLFVSDCVDAIFKILQKGRIGEIYNLGSGEERKNIEVVKIILNLLGKSENMIEFVKDRLGHDFRYSLNCTKLIKEIGWAKKVGFSVGIEITVNWYKQNMKWVETKLNYLRRYWEKAY